MADAQANINVNVNTADALAQIRALQRQLSSFYSEMAKGGAGASVQMANMQQNLINSVNATGKFSASMTTVRSTAEGFTNALEKNKLSLGEYFRFAGGSSKTFGKLFRSEFDTINKVARERVKTLQTQFIRLGRDANGAMQAIKVRPLALDMENLGTKVQMTAQRQQLFNQLVKQGSTNLLNFGKNTQWAGRQLMVGFTIPLMLFGTAATRAFQKIEEQAIKFRRVYGDMFTTEADTEKALKNVRELADEFTKYGIAVEKTMDLAAKVAQMGNVGKALEEQVTQATRLSVLGGMEQMDALDTTISLTNAFGISIEDLGKKIDFLNAAENQTILSIEDFNTAIPLTGSVVNELGGNVEDLAVLLTAMREAGINASQGGNALKSSLARLIAPSKAAQQRLSEMGINVMGIVENNAGNLMGTVMSLATELDKLDPLSRARAIEALFGKFQFARMSALFSNIVKEGSQANKVLQLTQNSAEELAILSNRELGRVEDSAATKFQKTLEQIQAALAPIGEEFLKAITPIVEFATRLLKQFNNLSDGTKQFVTNMIGLVGLIAPVFLMGLGLVFNLIANGIKAFQFLGNVLLGLSGKSKILGGGLDYLNQEQIEGLAAAGSLEQAHIRLQQAFTSEEVAVRGLVAAYREATIAQQAFGGPAAIASTVVRPRGFADGRMVPGYSKGKPVPGYSNGVFMVPGPKGAGDIVPAMLAPGEAVIPAEQTQKYGGLINAMISGNIPGYAAGRELGETKGYTNYVARYTPKLNDGGLSRGDALAELRGGGEAIYSPIIYAIAEDMGATSPEQVRAMVESNPQFKQFAGDLSRGVITGIASGAMDQKPTDAEIYGIVDTIRPTAEAGYSPEFIAAETMAREKVTMVEDVSTKRLNASRTDLRTGGRINLAVGSPAYKKREGSFAQIEDLLEGSVPQRTELSHLVDYQVGKPKDFAGERTLTDPASRLQENLELNREVIRDSSSGNRFEAPVGTGIVQAREIVQDPSAMISSEEWSSLGSQDGSAYSEGLRESTSAQMTNFIEDIKNATGHSSPHPFWKPQGVEDGQAYGEGYNEGSSQTIGSPGSNGIKPPPPPIFDAPAEKTGIRGKVSKRISNLGEKIGDKIDQSPLAEKIADKLAGKDKIIPTKKLYAEGEVETLKTAGKINTELRDKGLITDDMKVTAKGVAAGVVPVRVVDGKLDIGDGSIDRLADVSPAANEAAEAGDLVRSIEDNRSSAEEVVRSNEDAASATRDKAKQDKVFEKEDKRQNRQRGSMNALRGLGTATMVAGMATQVPGVVGETAQQLVGPLAALSGIAPILMALPGPMAALVAVIGAGVAVWMLYNKSMEKAYDEAFNLTKAMGVGSESMQRFAEFAGTVSANELMNAQRNERLSQFTVAPGKTTFGSAFIGSEGGEELVKNVKTSLNELGRDQTVLSVFSQLGNAVSQNILTPEQARSIAGNLGIAIGDIGLGMEINGKLVQLLGPNGEDFFNDPISLQIKLAEIQAEAVQDVLDDYLEKQSILEPFTGMENYVLGLGAGVAQGGDLDALQSIVDEERQARYDEGGFWSDVATFFTPPTTIARQIMQEQLGKVGASVANSLSQQQSIIDNLRIESEKRIAKAIEEGASYEEVQELRKKEADAISESIEAIKEQTQKSIDTLNSLSASDKAEQEKQMRQRLLDQDLPEGVSKSQVGKSFDDLFETGDFTSNYILAASYESGDFTFKEFEYLASLPEERKEIYYQISTNLGSGEASQIAQIANVIKDESVRSEFELSFEGLEGSELTDAIAQAEQLFKLGTMLGGDISLAVGFSLKNPEQMAKFMGDLDELEFKAADGGFDANISLMTEIFGAEQVMAMQEGILANQAEFDALPDEMQLQYGAYFTLFADIAASSPEMQELMEAATGLKGSAAVAAYVMDYLPSLGADLSGSMEGPETSSGGGGSPEAFDPLIKKLRDLRLATIDMKRGWDGMMQSLEKVFAGGTQSINIFDGLSNQIRKFGVGESLIEMIVGMDPDEYEKRKNDLFIFDKAGNIVGTTAKLKNMQAAFNAVALGEYINQQQRSLVTMRDQISAVSILTANGLSLAEAYEIVQNEALAAAIALGATREEIMEIVRLTREVSALRERSEKDREKGDAAKAVKKTNEEFEKRVAVLNKLSKAAGQYTNAQIDALMGDSNLQTLFLNPSIDSRALQQAIYNASRNAEIELKVKLATTTGKKSVFEEGFSKAMEAFGVQEQTIELKFRADVADDESVIRAAESQLSGLQFQLDDYQAEITRIEDQEKDINDAYEKRFEALDKIAQANEEIAAAQKSQLDIADALTRGDIAGAARAAQEARSQQAESAAKSQREQLERARDLQLGALTGRDGLNREQLEQRIRDLQMQIFNIEEDLLEPAQERIRLAQELRDEQIRSLMVLGKTREEWDKIKNNVDNAQINNWEFVEGMETALEIVDKLIEELGKAKPLPPPPPPPAPSGGGGGGGAPAPAPAATKAPTTTQSARDIALATGNRNIGAAGLNPPQTKQAADYGYGAGSPLVASQAEAKRMAEIRVQVAARAAAPGAPGALQRRAGGGMIVPKRMAMGGKAKGYPMGGLIPYKADGGFFKSLGSDTIPAMLTPGEFVVRRPAVRGFGVDNLEKINNGTYSDGSMYNYNLVVNVKSNSDPDRIARTVMKHIERVDSQKIRGNRI